MARAVNKSEYKCTCIPKTKLFGINEKQSFWRGLPQFLRTLQSQQQSSSHGDNSSIMHFLSNFRREETSLSASNYTWNGQKEERVKFHVTTQKNTHHKSRCKFPGKSGFKFHTSFSWNLFSRNRGQRSLCSLVIAEDFFGTSTFINQN